MKMIDENLPATAATRFRSAGHDVDSVLDEGLGGATDHMVLNAARRGGRLVVTPDRCFGDLRAYPPGSHAGVLVLRVDDQSPTGLSRVVDRLVGEVDLEALTGCVAVFHADELRVRRPPISG